MDIDLVLSALSKLTSSPPPVLLCAGLLALGYVFKFIPGFPNARIPLANLTVAMIIYPLIARADTGEINYTMRIPWLGAMVRDEIVAIIVFAIAWLAHAQILRRLIDNKYFSDKTAKDSSLTDPADTTKLTH